MTPSNTNTTTPSNTCMNKMDFNGIANGPIYTASTTRDGLSWTNIQNDSHLDIENVHYLPGFLAEQPIPLRKVFIGFHRKKTMNK